MQFSILGVPFKCTKDMFTWKKIWWTICVYWAQFWRGMIAGIGLLVVVVVAIVSSDFPQILQSTNNNPEQAISYWYQTVDASWIWMWGALLLGFVLGVVYLTYYTLINKTYKSFDREALVNGAPYSFWSWGFWKRFLLIVLIGVILGIAQGLVVDGMVVFFISQVLGYVLMHIYLHGGTWGFVPISKRQISLEKTAE